MLFFLCNPDERIISLGLGHTYMKYFCILLAKSILFLWYTSGNNCYFLQPITLEQCTSVLFLASPCYIYTAECSTLLAENIFRKLLCALNVNTLLHATLTICLPLCATCLHHQASKTAIQSQTLLGGPGDNRLHLQLPLLHSLCDNCLVTHLVRSATGSVLSSYVQGQSYL